MNLAGTIGTVFMVIDFIAIIFVMWFILIGFLRGWKKSLLNTLAFFIPFIVIILLSSLFANKLIDVNFLGLGSIRDFTKTLVESIATKQGGYSEDTTVIVDGFALALLKIVIYMLAIFVAWIASFIFKLIFKLTLKRFIYGPDKKKKSPTMKSRLIGIGVGFVRGVGIIFIFFGPLMALINFGDIVLQDVSIIQEITDTDDGYQQMSKQSKLIDDIHKSINKSVLYNILNLGKENETGIGLSGSVYGNIFSVEINGDKISVIKEYGKLRPVFPVVKKIIDTNSENENVITVSNLNAEDLKKINYFINDTKILKVIAPLIVDVSANILENENAEEYKNEIQILRNLDVNQELEIFKQLLITVVDEFHTIEINISNPEDILLEECLSDNVNEIMGILLHSQIFNEIAIPKMSEALITALGEDSPLCEILTPESLKLCLKTDIGTFLKVYQTLNIYNNLHDYIFNEEEFIYDNEAAIESLEDSINKLFSISLITGNEDVLIRSLLEIVNMELLDYDTLFKDIDVTWSEETKIIASLFGEILKVKDELIGEEETGLITFVKKDENGEYVIQNILNEVAQSDLLINVFVNFLNSYKNDENEMTEILNIINIDRLKEITDDELSNELNRLISIIDILNQMNLINESQPNLNKDSINQLITLLFDSYLVKDNERQIVEYIIDNFGLNDLFTEYGITLNFDNINWETEPQKLVNIFIAIMDFGSLEDFDFNGFFGNEIRGNQENIIKLIEALDDSQIFGPSLKDLINTLLDQTEYEIEITDDEYISIKNNTWRKEITILVDVIEYCRETIDNESNETIDGNQVANIMISASESIIASKVLGTALNELLGETGLNINPKNPDGSYKYDFRNGQVLKENANDIGSLINLVTAANDFDLSNLETSDQMIDTIVESIKSFDNGTEANELTNDLINEYLGSDAVVDLSTIDTEKEAQIIIDAYDIYKVDPDNFNLDDNPELKEKIEQSEVADEVLKLLGIMTN